MTERYDDKKAFCRFVPALLLFAAVQFGERTEKSQVETHTKHKLAVGSCISLSNSVSHDSISGSGWTCQRVGKIAILTIAKNCSISDSWGYSVIGSLPDGWKPNKQSLYPTSLQQSGNNDVLAGVQSNGEIFCQGKGTTWRSGWLFALIVYVIA